MAVRLAVRAANPRRVVRAVRRRFGRAAGEQDALPDNAVLDGGGDRTLKTDRVVLRPFSPRDLDRLASQMGRPGNEPSLPRWRGEEMLAKEIAVTYLTWVIWPLHDGEPLGIVGLSLLQIDGRPEHELGYRVFPPAAGRGLATEAASAVLRFAEEELGLRRTVSIVEPANAASIRMLEKLGLRHERDTDYGGVPVRLYACPSKDETCD
ncbi:GNAT family N-acetyltransferase [Alienimonas sp. DA493]|uniref:GNAT family N-acetyltransferase n=1 Tax=Alienimonas sp. DA493 TaxID=3373605 RepID=UPI0037542F9D